MQKWSSASTISCDYFYTNTKKPMLHIKPENPHLETTRNVFRTFDKDYIVMETYQIWIKMHWSLKTIFNINSAKFLNLCTLYPSRVNSCKCLGHIIRELGTVIWLWREWHKFFINDKKLTQMPMLFHFPLLCVVGIYCACSLSKWLELGVTF